MIVYCHPWNDFDLQYIDEAERNFNKRKNEHLSYTANCHTDKSALAKYALKVK